jgi:hypothetical protein
MVTHSTWTALIALMASLSAVLQSPIAAAETPIPVNANRQVQVYKLETIELVGTTRMTTEQLAEELNLTPGTPLNDDLVMSTRSRLLGLGLFKSAILIMRKGTSPGLAKLIVEVEDDEGVLTDWALGGELGVTLSEDSASNADVDSAPMDYRLGLVGRNLFTDMHRGSLFVDLDSKGEFRAGQIAYGLPRFAMEDAQFDAEVAATDVRQRYLDVLGFGGRGQGLWSRSIASLGEIQYGAAMYVNKKPDFAVPGFSTSVAGPKFAYYKETRLRGFFPGAGYQIGSSLLLSPFDTEQSVLEIALARTFNFGDLLYLTFDTELLTVGVDGYAVRGEGRFDVPLGRAAAGEDQAEVFVRLRGGHDSIDQVDLVGSAAIIGVRYHSSGFIAELALKVTKSPEELAPKTLGVTDEERQP